MELVGPYRVVGTLGTCPVGRVLSGVDAADNQVTLAVLDEPAAGDQRWREAFSFTANALARSGMRALHGDFTAPAPWVAVVGGPGPGAEQIFTALGQEYRPAAPHKGAGATVPLQPMPTVRPVSPGLVSPADVAPAVLSPAPGSGSGIVSGGPISGPSSWEEPSPQSRPAPGSSRRAAVIGGVIALIVLIPGIGTGVIANTLQPPQPTATAPVTPSPAGSGGPAASPVWALITPSPQQPGIEPPTRSGWPAAWPKLEQGDRTRDVEVLGLSLQVPENWTCTQVTRTANFMRYSCQSSTVPDTTGEILMRECPYRCDSTRRRQLRTVEEAWGAQWFQAGAQTSWAENTKLPGGRYGLVVVLFTRTATEETLNREVVFRMTAPANQINEVRRFANAIRDSAL